VDEIKVTRALISVSDKTGIAQFAKGIRELGVEIISTGGTAKLLRDGGVELTDISDYTGSPEIMDGRVKTLHPKVHGGLLAVRENAEHKQAMQELDIQPIDMVVVNLYPFEKTVAKPDVEMDEAIENIDIGGPSMVRSAAKNHKYVAVVTDPSLYDEILDKMRASGGKLGADYRFKLAQLAFQLTARYDTSIANYLANSEQKGFGDIHLADYVKAQDLRYGENPHQQAAFYRSRQQSEPSVSNAEKLSGKALSYNNILDIDGALELVKEFDEPAVAVIKHTNPCGAAVDAKLEAAFRKAYAGDPVSAFGSIVASNRSVDEATARAMADVASFVEAVIAPGYEGKALEILLGSTWGKNVRVLRTGELDVSGRTELLTSKKVVGGLLVQTRDLKTIGPNDLTVATSRKPTKAEIAELLIAWKIVKHVKSNAIVLVKDGALVGTGAGQMSRVDSTFMAIHKAQERSKGSVLASDAFFPFKDAVEIAAKAGITAIIQPGGAKRDEDVRAECDRLGVAMVLTGVRHFRH